MKTCAFLLMGIFSIFLSACTGSFQAASGTSSISQVKKYKNVKASGADTCATDLDDYLYCWGSEMYNQHGTGSGGDGLTTYNVSSPQLAFEGKKVADFDNNGFTTCIIDGETFEIKCAGYNFDGQVGIGSTSQYITAPTNPSSQPTAKKIRIGSVGLVSMVCASKFNNEASCWASNHVGDGTTTQRLVPTDIYSAGNGFSQLGVGAGYACGLIASSLYCWGAGIFGDGNFHTYLSPYPINTGFFETLSVGGQHSCGISNSGVLKCWGNTYGDGVNTVKYTPTVIDSGQSYRFVSAGYGHTCAITVDDILKCWGENTYGQIGDGTNITRSLPKIIDAGVGYKLVSVGTQSTCGITADNTLKCWGRNNNGQIGDGTTVDRYLPTTIN